MSSSTSTLEAVLVGSLSDLRAAGKKVISAGGRTILVVADENEVLALDNRCPHMGFPLHKGTVKDGILTCHWHHAKFDLRGGCTLDPFADDVPCFPVEVRGDEVWVTPRPSTRSTPDRWRHKLEEGLENNIRLVMAKSVVELEKSDDVPEILRRSAFFGSTNRRAGWDTGLTILTTMANVLPHLRPEDRGLALYHGVMQVARDTEGQPRDFDLVPLYTSEGRPERFLEWFRQFVDTRSSDAAERTLRTVIEQNLEPTEVSDLLTASSTDHRYLGGGHVLDFVNKAFELVEHVGWGQAEHLLPTLIRPLVWGERMEEDASWRHPVDLPALLEPAYAELEGWMETGGGRRADWDGHQALAEVLLDAEPGDAIAALGAALRDGVPVTGLSATVAYAAARRVVHFHVSNEFGDWNTVHHGFTYANALDQSLRRAPSALLARGIFDGAMAIYLERFLNVPKQSIPKPTGATPGPKDLLAAFDEQGQVDATAQVVVDMLATGDRGAVIRTLGQALLREDASFHMYQMYEAAVRQAGQFAGRAEGDHVLIGAARFLSAHSPTVRSLGQTYRIAVRLQRGDALHEEG